MLSLSEVSKNDIGTYTCTAEFSNKIESSAAFYLTQTSEFLEFLSAMCSYFVLYSGFLCCS